MSDRPLKSYIAGKWTAPQTPVRTFEAINSATKQRAALVALCAPDDVDTVVAAARAAFPAYAALSLEARILLAANGASSGSMISSRSRS